MAAVIAGVLLLVALAIGGRSLRSDEGPLALVDVEFYFYPSEHFDVKMLTVTFSDGIRKRTFTGVDFDDYNGDGQLFGTGRLATLPLGRLTVSFTLTSEEGVLLSSGKFDLPLKPDWGWGIDFMPGSHNPLEGCFGCLGAQVFLINPGFRAAPDDALYVVWGGNSISNPAVY